MVWIPAILNGLLFDFSHAMSGSCDGEDWFQHACLRNSQESW